MAKSKPPDYFSGARDLKAAWHLIPPALKRMPRCPCGAGVCRPKCFVEADPAHCPRFPLLYEWQKRMRKALRKRVENRDGAGI